MRAQDSTPKPRQQGVAAVEFALVATILFMLLFGIIEFGRLFFTINSVQEITRRAAREQVVNWLDRSDAVKRVAVLQTEGGGPGTVNFPNATGPLTVNFPGSPDITAANVQLRFYNTYAAALAGGAGITGIASASDNFVNCINAETNCIKFVRAAMMKLDGTPLDFKVVAPYMPAGTFPLPISTVIMPAEALGLL